MYTHTRVYIYIYIYVYIQFPEKRGRSQYLYTPNKETFNVGTANLGKPPYIYTYIYICIYAYTYIYIHIYIYTHIYRYVYIYIYIFANQDAPYTPFEATASSWNPPRRSFASRSDGLRGRVEGLGRCWAFVLAVFHDVEPGQHLSDHEQSADADVARCDCTYRPYLP